MSIIILNDESVREVIRNVIAKKASVYGFLSGFGERLHKEPYSLSETKTREW